MCTSGLCQVHGVQCVLGQRLEIGRLGFRNEVAACLILGRDAALDISSVDDSLEACICDDILI